MRIKKLDRVREQILTGYGNGMTLEQLSTTYQVTKGTVRNFLILNGTQMRRVGRRRGVSKTAEVTS